MAPTAQYPSDCRNLFASPPILSIVSAVVRRTRPMLEERALLKRIGVIAHPRADDGLSQTLFDEQGLVMGLAFTAAYEAAEAFSRLYATRQPAAGFLKTILLRRIGSSARAGLETARHLLGRIDATAIPEDEIGDEGAPADEAPPDPQEIELLREVERNLVAVVDGADVDPKVQVVLHYLRERRWLEENGAIIFSQYRTTAEWVLEALCAAFPDEPVALYAGGSASFVQRGSDRHTAARELIKASIQNGDIRLVCATDAACEGLNLQRLGAQVNIDLPWNPSRLEQRKGRVQRIGQVRDNVHILNLRYAGTVEDDVYAALSDRLGDIFSVLGQLPMPSRINGSKPCCATVRRSGTSPSAWRKPGLQWSCGTCATWPTTKGSIGNTLNEFCPRATSMRGCGRRGDRCAQNAARQVGRADPPLRDYSRAKLERIDSIQPELSFGLLRVC